MNILHVIDSGGFYGAEAMLMSLALEQLKKGDNPIVASIAEVGLKEKPLETAARKSNVPYRRFEMGRGYSYTGVRELVRYALDNDTHILHSHGYKGNILLGALPRKWRTLPLISTLHGYTNTKKISKMRLYEALDRYALRRHDCVVCVNTLMLADPRVRAIGNPNICVIDNGIACPENKDGLKGKFLPGNDLGLDQAILDFVSGTFVVGTVGRLSKEKGYDVLVTAFKRLHDVYPLARLVFVGEGPEQAMLETLIADYGITSSVLFTGYRDDAIQLMALMDVYVNSSWTEGLPITILEAMRAEIPIVASRVGGMPEALDDGRCGILVEAGSFHQIADMLIRIALKSIDTETLVARAWTRLRSKYTIEVMAQKYNDVYNSVQTLHASS